MDRGSGHSVVTRAFFVASGSVRARVHFFPSAGITAGHYPVGCELVVFGKGIEKRSVYLEGGRLNQPDGIRIEDAFPALVSEGSAALFGLEVRLSCSQGRIDLLSSRVAVEMVSPHFSLVFNAGQCRADSVESDEALRDTLQEAPELPEVGMVTHDSVATPSLVIVNSGSELERPDIRYASREGDTPLHLGTVAAESVVEFPLDEALCKHGLRHETLWGDTVVERFWNGRQSRTKDVSWYLLYRDPVMKRPISVCAL